MATEQHRVVIGVDYVGDADVQRYLAALQRIGAVTEQQVARIRSLTSTSDPNGGMLAGILEVDARRLRDYETRANAAVASTAALNREVRSLHTSLAALQSTMRGGGEVAGDQLRRQLFNMLQANQVALQIADAGRRAYANARSLPGGDGSGIPAYQTHQISRAYAAPVRGLTVGSQQPEIDFAAAARSHRESSRRMERVVRALERDAAAVRAPTQVREATDLIELVRRAQAYQAIYRPPTQLAIAGPGEFASGSEKEARSRQDMFLRVLRQRIAAEQLATEAAQAVAREQRRVEGFYRRLAAIEARGGVLDLGPGGSVQAAFPYQGPTFAAQAAGVQRGIDATSIPTFSAQKVNAYAKAVNEQLLNALVVRAQANSVTDGEALHAQMFRERAERLRGRQHDQLFYGGGINAAMLRQMSREERILALGSEEGSRAYGLRSQDAVPIPGFMDRDGARAQLFDESAAGQRLNALTEALNELNGIVQRGPGRYGSMLALPMVASTPQAGTYVDAQRAARVAGARLTAERAALGSQGIGEIAVTPQGIASVRRELLALEDAATIAARATRRQRDESAAYAAAAGGTGRGVPPGGGGTGGGGGGGFFNDDAPEPEDEYDRLRREFEKAQASTWSRLESARSDVTQAEATQRQLRARASIPYGEKGGFRDEDDALKAVAANVRSLNGAYERLQKRLDEHAAAEAAATGAAQRKAASDNRRAAAGGAGFMGGGGSGSGGFFGGPPTGPGGGFWSDFRYGFHGRQDKGYAEQLGQTFKFSLFYGTAYNLLFAMTQTFAQVLQEGIEFQQAMTDLSIAAGRPKEELDQLSAELSQSALRAGFAPSQGLQVGARSLGLYGVTQAPTDVQDQIANISARVVNQLAVGAKKAPAELQGDIAAIAQALGLGAFGQQQIADLDAYMTKRFGVQQGATLETLAQSASVGKAAGFSDEQLFAIAANMISRTGQTSSAVAGFMAQIFSRGGEGSLVDVARARGIDPNQELSGIVRELAALYEQVGPREQAEISAAFGRGKIQNAAVALLGDYDEVLAASGAGRSEAVGAADRQFEERMKNIGGMLRTLAGEFSQFAQLLGTAGLLDGLGALVIVLTEFLRTTNVLLSMWNELPRTFRDLALAVGVAAVALRFMGGGNAVAGGLTTLMARGAGGDIMNLAGRSNAAGAMAAVRGLAGMIGPIGLAVGGLYAVGQLGSSSDELAAAQRQAARTLLSAPVAGADSAGFRAYGSELRAQARGLTQDLGWADRLNNWAAGRNPQDDARELRLEARRVEALARRLEVDEQSRPSDSSVFRGIAADDLAEGLTNLENSGLTASEQLRELRDVLFGTAEAAAEARNSFDPELFAAEAAGGLRRAAARSIRGLEVSPEAAGFIAMPKDRFAWPWEDADEPAPIRGRDLQGQAARVLSGRRAQRRLVEGMSRFGMESTADFTEANVEELAGFVGQGMARRILGPGAGADVVARWQEAINEGIGKSLLRQVATTRQQIIARDTFTAEEAKAAADVLVSRSQEKLEGMPETDLAGRGRVLRQRIADLRRVQRKTTGADVGAVTRALDVARREYAGVQFEELEAMRKSAQQNADSKQEIQAIGRRFLNRAIRMAVRNRSGDVLAQIIGNAGKASIAIATQAINDAIAVANAAIAMADQMADAAGYLQGQTQSFLENQIAQAELTGQRVPQWMRDAAGAGRDKRRLKSMGRAVRQTQYDPDNTSVKGLDSGNPNLDDWYGTDAAAEEDRDSPLEIAAARANAFAQRSEGQVAAARAAIMSARASLAEAEKNTVAYWSAMGELFSAQNALVDALQAYQKNRMMLNRDMTNPLAMARVETRAAAIKLREDIRSGAAPDVVAQDRVDLRSARANQEATAFSQRLQSVQTAEQLGRISHSKYINYLENEKKRLESIKDRSFQQQQQLDQIDGLLQDAAKQMQGQFNLGDIKLPTPYQVRRYIEQTSGAATARMAAQGNASQTTTLTMYVDGADTAKVTQIVQNVVGKPARTRTAAPRRR